MPKERTKKTSENIKEDNIFLLKNLYKVLVETSIDCIKLFDIDGKLLYINEAGLKEHKLKNLSEAKKWDYFSCVEANGALKLNQIFSDALKKGKTSTISLKHLPGMATRDECLVTLAPVNNDNGKIAGVLGISRDITEVKKSGKLIEHTRDKLAKTVEKKTKELEEKIEELSKLNNLMIGRELKMLELKKEILDLKGKLKSK